MGIDFSVTFTGPNGYPLEGDIKGDAEAKELLQYLQRNQVRIAKAALAEELANGRLKNPFTIVDGKRNAPVESVKPLGKIQFVEPITSLDFLYDIYEAIIIRSPVDTGLYKSQHVVFYNNSLVASTLDGLQRWIDLKKGDNAAKPGDVFRFVNIVPYARKLERYGRTSEGGSIRTRTSRDKTRYKGRKFKVNLLAENGPYYLASRYATRIYGRNVQTRFELFSGRQLAGIPTFTSKSGKPMRTTFAKTGDAYVYPSIKVVLTAEGVAGGNA